MDDELRCVLSRYAAPFQPSSVECLGNAGGLSGARIWRLATPRGPACLRQWPAEHPSRQQLHWIHQVLLHWSQDSIDVTPAPWPARQGDSFVEHGGRFWELGPWLAGRADFRDNPSPARLQATMQGLARLHRSAAKLHQTAGASPSVLHRLEGLRGVETLQVELAARSGSGLAAGQFGGPLAQLDAAWRSMAPPAARRLEPLLARAAERRILRQPALRDVRHDHLLFQEDRLVGLVDFGAMRIDDVATDLARCLRSLLGAPVLGGRRRWTATRRWPDWRKPIANASGCWMRPP